MMDGYRFVDCDIAEAAAQRKPQQARRQDAVSTGE
jgi:hypothetical protein